MTDDEPLDPLVGQVLAARYRVLRVLGEGGMGRVYLAEHVRMGRLSAVKVMSPALMPTDDAVSRFNREASNASRINHPNVAAIYDFGEGETGTLYLAMEYVDGETLAALLRREGALPPVRAAGIARQIADALNAAHLLGIIHRDLKPDNVLVTTDAEGNELVKVVDFGIAKSVQAKGQTVTTVGMSIGTPEYMSPEQLAGESLDARSDIYSLGLVTFVMLTTELPYPDVTSRQSLVRRLTEPPRTLAEVRPDIAWSPALQAALTRALSPDAHDRYPKATEFAREVVAASPPGDVPGAGRTRPMTPLSSAVIGNAMPTATPGRVAIGAGVADRVVAGVPAPPRRRGWMVAALLLVAFGVAGALMQRSRLSGGGGVAQSVMGAPSADGATAAVSDSIAPRAGVAGRDVGSMNANGHHSVMIPGARRPPQTPAGANGTSSRTATVPKSPAAATSPAQAAPAPAVDSAPASVDGAGASALSAAITGHLDRARTFAMERHSGRATAEFRIAVEQYLELAQRYPDAPSTSATKQQVVTATREALAACQARDTLPQRGRSPCEPLVRAAAVLEGGALESGAFQGGRRRMRSPARAP